MKEDHRSYRCNFGSCKKKASEKFRLVQDSNLSSATPVQLSTIEQTLDLCNASAACFFQAFFSQLQKLRL